MRISKRRTEADFGYEFAEQGTFDSPVNINEMVTGTVDIPSDDYLSMRRYGIETPDARQYWKGFNSYFR